MSSVEETKDDSKTLRDFGINIAFIFGVLTALIIISMYFADTSS
ncbi:hypothetical protein SAMN05421754_105111 [Nitrosomonas sp. Nm58]|jgi:hypothetical protein|nr:hypothetical protein SAMN05421754_105111 [Nitrosomonas sp. Nm58]